MLGSNCCQGQWTQKRSGRAVADHRRELALQFPRALDSYCQSPGQQQGNLHGVLSDIIQIYTDWLYLWWIGYTNGMHGRIYVVLKESLRRIPVIGWGMQFSQFIFLKRNWDKDKDRLAAHLQKLSNNLAPMWLMLFPEGTNLHPVTRKASKKWAVKNKIPDMQHQLLPRSKGLQFCIQQLRKTTPYVYDCTIAYEGVKTGQYASEIFTIQAAYFRGKPPKSVNMYWRRFDVWSIPVDNDRAFDNWLRARWIEKDQLLDHYQKTGRFPADTGVDILPDGHKRRGAGYIETEVKPNKWYEYLQVFAPVGLLALVLYMFYGGLPKRFMRDIGKQTVQQSQIEGPQNTEQLVKSTPRIVEVDSANGSFVGSSKQIAVTKQTTAATKKAIKKLPPKKHIASAASATSEPQAVTGTGSVSQTNVLASKPLTESKPRNSNIQPTMGKVSHTSGIATKASNGEARKKLGIKEAVCPPQMKPAVKPKPNAVQTPSKAAARNTSTSGSLQPSAPKFSIKSQSTSTAKTGPKKPKSVSNAATKTRPRPKKLEIKPKPGTNSDQDKG